MLKEVRDESEQFIEDDTRRLNVRRALAHQPTRFNRIPWRIFSICAVLCMATAFCMIWFSSHRAPQELSGLSYASYDSAPLAVGEFLGDSANSTDFQFSDGSAITLDVGTRARVTELAKKQAKVHLESGKATFDVKNQDVTKWQVTAGPYKIDSNQAIFNVNWDVKSDAIKIEVIKGTVVVSSQYGMTKPLKEGQIITLSSVMSAQKEQSQNGVLLHDQSNRKPSEEPKAGDHPTLPTPSQENTLDSLQKKTAPLLNRETEDSAPPTKTTIPEHPKKVSEYTIDSPSYQQFDKALSNNDRNPKDNIGDDNIQSNDSPSLPRFIDWQENAREGHFKEAYKQLASINIEAVSSNHNLESLMLMALTLRYAGDNRAQMVYQRAIQRFPNESRSQEAAFFIARLKIRSGQSKESEQWLIQYLEWQPDGRFAKEARGRLLEYYSNSKEYPKARKLAKTYLAKHPQGPHKNLAHTFLK